MTPSDACINWVKHCETCSLKAYWDVDGYSIGWGYHSPEIAKDTVWTQEEADTTFMSRLFDAAREVDGHVHVPLTQGQFDALVDFVYNDGAGNFQSSMLLRHVNAGLYDAACQDLYWVDERGAQHGWIFAGGKINQALVARRKGDQVLWNGGNPLEEA